jgi:hypothetical protein
LLGVLDIIIGFIRGEGFKPKSPSPVRGELQGEVVD